MAVNYAAFQDAQNPLDMAMKGYADAGALHQAQQQRQIGQQNIDLNQQKVAAYKQAQAKQQAYQEDLAGLGGNLTAQGIQSIMLKYPQLGEGLRANFDMLNAEQKQNKIVQATQISSALAAGGVPEAMKLINTLQVAAENSGDEANAVSLKVLSDQVEMNPDAALMVTDMFLNANMGPEQYASFYEKRNNSRRADELQTGKRTKQQAEIEKVLSDTNINITSEVRAGAGVGVDMTHLIGGDPVLSNALRQLAAQKKAMESTKDVDEREKRQIENDTKRDAYETTLRERQNELETSMANINMVEQTLNQLDAIGGIVKGSPGPMGSKNTVFESATGPISSMTMTLDDDVADFEEVMKTLTSQVFLSQVSKMKGLGALGVAEGDKLMGALGSLNLRQSPRRLRATFSQIRDSLTILRGLAAKKGGPGLAEKVDNINNPPEEAVSDQQQYDAADAIIGGQ